VLIGSIVVFLAAILFLGFFLFSSSLAMAQLQQQQQTISTTTTTPPSSSLSITTIPPLTPEEQEQQNRLQSIIAATTANLNETEKQVNGVIFTPRWSEPVWVNANSIAVLIAYCLPGEFADSGQEILGGFGLEVLESYAVDLPQGFMAWMAVVGNEDGNVRLPAALGVICASDLNRPDTRILNPQEQQQINNVISQFTTIQNTQITNIDQVINIINNVTTPTQNETGGMTPPPTTEQPLIAKIIPNATEGVIPVYFNFDANVTGGTGPYTYSWDFGEDNKPNGSSLSIVVVKPTTLNVILTVYDSKNHTASDSIQIPVQAPSPPTVEIISNGTEGVAPATFKFEMNLNAGSQPYYWLWDFGDGQYSQLQTVEHTFKRAGTYNVVLQVTDYGGSGSDNILITVKARGPQGGVTVEPTEEPGTPPPTVPEGGGDTGGGRGPQGGVTVEPTEEPGTPPPTVPEGGGDTGGGRGPQGGVTVEPTEEPGTPPPTVPGDTTGGNEEGDTGGRGPQGGVTVGPTEEPPEGGEEEEPTIPPGGQPP
jgi:PKD repeat protein